MFPASYTAHGRLLGVSFLITWHPPAVETGRHSVLLNALLLEQGLGHTVTVLGHRPQEETFRQRWALLTSEYFSVASSLVSEWTRSCSLKHCISNELLLQSWSWLRCSPLLFSGCGSEILYFKKLEWVVKSSLLPTISHLSLQLLHAPMVIFTCRMFFHHSSAAGQDGVHLASVLTKDKWALGPQWFTLAARGFQNSKLFFITAMWYEVSCSRCSNVYYSRPWSGEFIKFPRLSKKSHLSDWLAFCLCQLKVHSPEARKRLFLLCSMYIWKQYCEVNLIILWRIVLIWLIHFLLFHSVRFFLFFSFALSQGCRRHESMIFTLHCVTLSFCTYRFAGSTTSNCGSWKKLSI